MKTLTEVLEAAKGTGNANTMQAGKAPYSASFFSELVHAAANDTQFKIPQYNPNTGEKVGDINISEMLRADMKKTIEAAKYPQKSEAGVLDSVEISTKGLEKSITQILMLAMGVGKKVNLPAQPDINASIYLADVPAKSKKVNIRDPKTQEPLGVCQIDTAAYKQVRAQSRAPKYLQKKTKRAK